MNSFKSFFFLEFKRFLNRRNQVALVWFLFLSLYLVQTGVNQYKIMDTDKDNFQETERLKVQQFNNYEQYGGYGFRLLFIPSPLSIFFNNTALFTELTSDIDNGAKLDIYNSLKGKNVFTQKPGEWLDFAGVILLFGSFMALFFGYDSLRNREYLKFLATFHSYPKIFINTCLSRIILLTLFFVLVIFCGTLLLVINGIDLTANDFLHLMAFILTVIVLLLFFFSIGTILASFRTKLTGLLLFLIWFVFVYLMPGLANKINEANSDSIPPNYQLELKKVNRLMDFEKDAIKQKDKKLPREMAESYYKEVLPQILSMEAKESLEKGIKQNVNRFHRLSAWLPTTFYFAVNKEISSRGYRNLIGFYENAIEVKKKFTAFYLEKRYPPKSTSSQQSGAPKIEPFIKKSENVFQGQSIIPFYFTLGVLIGSGYILLLFTCSYFFNKRSLFYLLKEQEKSPPSGHLKIELQPGETSVILSSGKAIYYHLYNVFSGRNKKFNGKVSLDGDDITVLAKKHGFVYICHVEDIPQYIKAGDFVSFMCRIVGLSKLNIKKFKEKLKLKKLGGKYFKELEWKDKGEILLKLALMKKSKIYVLYDFVNGMPKDFIEEFIARLEKLKKEESAILYFTNDFLLAPKIGDSIVALKKDLY